MICNEALQIIKDSETLKLEAYLCPAKVLTIGYGHTGADVHKGMVITEEQAENLLKADIERFEKDVRSLVKVKINENQFGALVSFAFNVGSYSFSKSTLLKKINNNDFTGASDEFLRWVWAKTKKLNGLTTRRKKERLLFLKPLA